MKMNVKNEVKAKVKVESSGRMHYNSQVRCGDDTERRNEVKWKTLQCFREIKSK